MNVLQVEHFNPDCDQPLIVPVLVLPNTPEEVGDAQIRANARLPLPWLASRPAHSGVAVICGGGPSLGDTFQEACYLLDCGGTLFGLNGASGWLSDRGLYPDYQIVLDAKSETATLVDPKADQRLFSSQVHPETAKHATMLFHLANVGMTDLLPADRVADGGFTLVGGGVSVGITSLCVAYTLGFRDIRVFGFDSSDRERETHAYPQPMNALIPKIKVEWAGTSYTCQMPMKVQADAFMRYAAELQAAGCKIRVYGDGLLPAMWNKAPMTEREKYQALWNRPDYRAWAPGEDSVATFLDVAKPGGLVIDFGCGTGRAALAISKAGHEVLCVDFTDNCRDRSASHLPFVQHDLTQPLRVSAPYGYCTDVMEHIPTDDVPAVIANIMGSVDRCFFQIATVPDSFGAVIGQTLHLTVQPHEWWAERFAGYRIEWQERTAVHSSFYIQR